MLMLSKLTIKCFHFKISNFTFGIQTSCSTSPIYEYFSKNNRTLLKTGRICLMYKNSILVTLSAQEKQILNLLLP